MGKGYFFNCVLIQLPVCICKRTVQGAVRSDADEGATCIVLNRFLDVAMQEPHNICPCS